MSYGAHDYNKISGICSKCGAHASVVQRNDICPGIQPGSVEAAVRHEEKRLDQMVAAERMTKGKLLDAAKATVADRGVAYGGVEDNFARIAEMWNAHCRNRGIHIQGCRAFTPVDVAIMMVLMKAARLQNQPNHLDSWTDIAGYAACGAEISQDLPKSA